jgi:hypothetical protein
LPYKEKLRNTFISKNDYYNHVLFGFLAFPLSFHGIKVGLPGVHECLKEECPECSNKKFIIDNMLQLQ